MEKSKVAKTIKEIKFDTAAVKSVRQVGHCINPLNWNFQIGKVNQMVKGGQNKIR